MDGVCGSSMEVADKDNSNGAIDGRGSSSGASSGPTATWQRGFKKIGTLLLMAEKLFFICSKKTTRSKAQAMRASFFICNFSIIRFL